MLPKALPNINPTASPPSILLYARKAVRVTITTIRIKKPVRVLIAILVSASIFFGFPVIISGRAFSLKAFFFLIFTCRMLWHYDLRR